MRRLTLTLSMAALALATSLPAQASGRHGPGHDHGRWQPAPVYHGGAHGGHGRHGGHHGHHGHHRGGSWAPWVVGGLIGAAIIGAANNSYAQPAPQPVVVPVVPASTVVYPAPAPAPHMVPTPAAPPLLATLPPPNLPRAHYYCAPYRAYFPAVAECPVQWTLVPY